LNLIPSRFVDDWAIQRSDQWSFLQVGYPALLAIEGSDDFNPHYHSISDTLSRLDLDYYTDFTRAAVATIAHLGRPLPDGRLSGTIYALDTAHPLSATVRAFAPMYHTTFTTMTDARGQYSLSLPVGSYTLTVWPASPGHYPATVTNTLVITDAITVQDIALAPWPRLYLPRIVHEP
jgi:hypothetical protein